MNSTELDKMELFPALDRVVDKSPWTPFYYSQIPEPEDFGLAASRVDSMAKEEAAARENERKRSRLFFKGTIMASAFTFFVGSLIYGSGILSAFGAGLMGALFPGFYPLALIVSDTRPGNGRLPATHLRPYYNYRTAVSHYKYWQRKQDIDYLRSLSGLEFEHAVAAIFSRLGYKATVTKASGDNGIDIFILLSNDTIPIQCKNHAKSQGPGVIREFIGALHHGEYGIGAIVSTSGFSKAARELARENNILLLDDMWLRLPRRFS